MASVIADDDRADCDIDPSSKYFDGRFGVQVNGRGRSECFTDLRHDLCQGYNIKILKRVLGDDLPINLVGRCIDN